MFAVRQKDNDQPQTDLGRGASPASRDVVWTVTQLRSRDDVERLRPVLDQLDWSSPGCVLFQTSGWLSATLSAALRPQSAQAFILIARRFDVPVAALPIAIFSRFGVRVARILSDPLAQYSDMLKRSGESPQLIVDGIRSAIAMFPSFDVLLMPRVRDDANVLPLIQTLNGTEIGRSAAPHADLTRYSGFDAFLKDNWKAHRNRNRLRRRATAQGKLRFEIASSPDRAAELTRHAVQLKREWLRDRFRLFGTLSHLEWCDALVNCVRLPASSTQPVISALHCDEKIAAVELGFVRAGRYYAFLGAYDPECVRWSPTDLLMEDTLAWCFANQILVYDLLPPDDAYKFKWTNDVTPVTDWAICCSRRGRLYVHLCMRFLPLVLKSAYVHGWRLYRWARAGYASGLPEIPGAVPSRHPPQTVSPRSESKAGLDPRP